MACFPIKTNLRKYALVETCGECLANVPEKEHLQTLAQNSKYALGETCGECYANVQKRSIYKHWPKNQSKHLWKLVVNTMQLIPKKEHIQTLAKNSKYALWDTCGKCYVNDPKKGSTNSGPEFKVRTCGNLW